MSMPSTPLPENVVRSLSRFLFACIPPGQAVVQLFDPNHGDLYLIKGSDDSEHPSSQSSPGNLLSELGLRSPPHALLNELVESLRFAIQDDRRHSTATPDGPASPSPIAVCTLSTLTDLSEMSFADPGTLDTSGPLSDLRGNALFYSVEGEAQGVFSPLPPVSPTPHRSGSPLRLHGDRHPSHSDASSSSVEGTAGSGYSQPHEGEEPYITCASIQPSFTSEGSPILGERSSSSPLKLFGLSSLPTGLSPPPPQGTPSFRTSDLLSGLSASHITADFLTISPPPPGLASPSAKAPHVRPGDFRAACSPTTSTPVRDAMRRALAVMIMHRNSPQARLPRGRSGRVGREARSTSPLSRSELVSVPAGEAAARIVAAVKAREQDRTRVWAAKQASAGAARHLDVSAGTGMGMGLSGSGGTSRV